ASPDDRPRPRPQVSGAVKGMLEWGRTRSYEVVSARGPPRFDSSSVSRVVIQFDFQFAAFSESDDLQTAPPPGADGPGLDRTNEMCWHSRVDHPLEKTRRHVHHDSCALGAAPILRWHPGVHSVGHELARRARSNRAPIPGALPLRLR